jgi:hypothetical protein
MVAAGFLIAQEKRWRTAAVGYSDTPVLPGQKWRVHDIDRPHPRVITPGATPGAPPSDATVLFDGKDLSLWAAHGKGADKEKIVPAGWKVENGYMEIAPGSGDIFTREKFGDCQLHVEWATPTVIDGTSQWRGNSGIMLMGRYEIQVLDSFGDITYADGQAASIYGQWPPLVNASRGPGQWQSYDIVFEAPKFEGQTVAKQAYVTVFHNGVVVHNRHEIIGPSTHRAVAKYSPHGPEEALALQDHDTPVRYRNIWIRRLRGYDQP